MRNLEHLVIDADQMIYSCGFATEGEPEHHAFKLINDKIAKSLTVTTCSRYTVYIKGKGNFREDIALDYKATRSGRKPEHYDAIVEFLLSVHDAQKVDGMEADDMVSLLLWQDFVNNDRDPDMCTVILSSPDKDLKNTPGWHLNPTTGDVSFISESQSNRHLAYQMLAGDRVDNIKGLPNICKADKEKYGCRQKKVGEKTAKKLLEGLGSEESFQRVGELYYNAGYTMEYMQEQFDLLWMARDMDPFEENTPVLGHTYEAYDLCRVGFLEAQSLETPAKIIGSSDKNAELAAIMAKGLRMSKYLDDLKGAVSKEEEEVITTKATWVDEYVSLVKEKEWNG